MDLAEHNAFTNWGDYKSNWITTNQIKCWFFVGEENRSTREKTSHDRVENQQTQSDMTAAQEIEPEPYWWKASALTTPALLTSKTMDQRFELFAKVLDTVPNHGIVSIPHGNFCS